MKRKSYQKLSIFLPTSFLVIFIILEYSEEFKYTTKIPLILLSFHLLKPILALLTFYFAIYFLKAKIKPDKNEIGPRSLIFLGTLFMLLSFVQPAISYYFTHDLFTELYTPQRVEEQKKFALDINRDADKRRKISRLVYFETGEKVNYLDENGKVVTYTPTKEDEEKHIGSLNARTAIEASKTAVKYNFLYHSGLLLIFSVLFFVFLRVKPPSIFYLT